jgi:hypothetical protein
MTAEVAQSSGSKRVTTSVVATLLRSLVRIRAAIRAFFRASKSPERRTESVAVEIDAVTTSQIPTHAQVADAGISPIADNELGHQEIERRRNLVRALFNDFWSGEDQKPASFAARLDRAEDYLNERLAANGETWRLDTETRAMLSLPSRSSAPN